MPGRHDDTSAEYDHWLHVARLAFGDVVTRVALSEFGDDAWEAYKAPGDDSIGDDADDYIGYVYDDGGTFWAGEAIHRTVEYDDGTIDRRYTGQHLPELEVS